MPKLAIVLQTHFDCLDLQFQSGVFVNHHQRSRMELQCRKRVHMIDSSFDTLLQSESFVRASDNNHNFSRIEHCLHAHCKRHLGNLRNVVIEESGIGAYCVFCQCLDSSS